MIATAAVNAYAKVGIESNIASADPHKLISLLFQGALLSIANAKNGIMRQDIPAKGAAICKAISIIGDGLLASLNREAGGEIAHNLYALYNYMILRLSEANTKNDVAILDEVANLLTGIKEAWDAIRPTVLQADNTTTQKAGVHA